MKNNSIDRLEDVLRQQRQKLDTIQRNQHLLASAASPFNGERSKEMIEFDLSEASPQRQSQKSYGTGQFSNAVSAGRNQNSASANRQQLPPGSSSVNLEKAYEELEREIQEIKAKLHQSISMNDSNSDVKYRR